MASMTRWIAMVGLSVVLIGTVALALLRVPGNDHRHSVATFPQMWSRFVSPGKLSTAHAALATNCDACHAPYSGPARERCVICHAAPTQILQKQNSAFHSSINSCVGCHVEHQGDGVLVTEMDHARIDPQMFPQKTPPAVLSNNNAPEDALNCNACHSNEDRHRGLFGADCRECHSTTNWTIAAFRHPSPLSHECAQCHTAPPSHYMMHFQMISEKVAGVEHAQVRECYQCHLTTSWNDIKGVGWYKHH